MTSYSQARKSKGKHVDFLLAKKNVVGVGVGKKIVDGQITDEISIKVYVQSKTALSRLEDEDIIPKELENVKTDVVEVGRIVFQGNRDKNRPTQGGDSIGSCHSIAYGYIMAGTLGVALIDKTDGKRVLLSNNHVLANMDNDSETRANAGDNIVQPGTLDGGSCSSDVIGTLKRWIPFKMNGDNEVDAAIADLNTASDALECQIGYNIGKVDSVKELTESDVNVTQVQKFGRTTGYTTGTVMDVDATINVGYEVLTPSGPANISVKFVDQILLTDMSDAGDSGSIILDMNNKAVGLLFAGSSTVTVANKIQVVLDRMNLEFCPRHGGPILCITGGPWGSRCRPLGPTNAIHCVIGGPDNRIVEVHCITGGPDSGIIRCSAGSPNVVGPLCLACGPNSPIGCGTGGPDNLLVTYGCSSGPNLTINFKDPLIDPTKIVIINKDKIPRDMQKSIDQMLKKMAEER